MQDELNVLEALGFVWPSPAFIVGAILFGFVGMYAFYVGKRRQRPKTKWLGVGLMFYPYAVPSTATWALYAFGAALCVGVWMDRAA
jgi:hypothetical protein